MWSILLGEGSKCDVSANSTAAKGQELFDGDNSENCLVLHYGSKSILENIISVKIYKAFN